MAWNEDRLHLWLARGAKPRALYGSRGHDAAVLVKLVGRPVTCVDQTVEGVHFEPGTPGRRVGVKAVGRALSDLAATAARPRALLLAVSAPAETREVWLRNVIQSVAARGASFGADLVGGDLCCAGGPVTLTVTALGELSARRRPPGRDRAHVGQHVVLTGPVGGSRLGRHLAIEPRIDAGRWLFECGATAMMDVSDGLAWDLFRLARASGKRIDLDEVPVHRDAERRALQSRRGARWHALHDGEDHELVATLPTRALERARAEAGQRCPGFEVIGRVRRGRGLRILQGDRYEVWRAEGGWRHGR